MASYRNYGDTGAYRSRTGVGIASTFGRNASGGSNLPSCRSNYSGVGSSSARVAVKERPLAGFGSAFLKKDKLEEKPTFKYSCVKDKSRLHSGRSSSEDVRSKSPLSDSRSSLYERYSLSAGKTSERPSSVLDKYNRAASREKSRETDGISRYGSSTYPGSSFGRSYGNDGRIEKKDHPPVSYRGLRSNSGRTSREPSPEVSVGKTNSFRVYSRAPSYSRSAASPNTSESSSATISTRFGSTASSRFLSSRSSNERASAATSYSTADRFRNTSSKSINQKNEEELRLADKRDKDSSHESSKPPSRTEENDSANNRIPDEFVTLTMVTRGTSPTPPASSSYVRSRRAEIGIVYQKEMTRLRKPPDSADEETQCDRMEETSRFSRYGSANRISSAPWSAYLDKYSSGATSTGSSSVYPRGFAGTSSSSGRSNNFAYTRTNEASVITRNEIAAKETSSSSQETRSSGNRSQNEKAFGGLSCTRTDDETSAAPDNPKTSNGQNVQNTNDKLKKGRVQSYQQCSCGARKIDTNGSPHSTRTPTQDSTTLQKEDSMTQDIRESKNNYDDCNHRQRRPSIPRLGCGSPKREAKIPKCTSKTEFVSPKSEARCERRESTSKSGSDASFSSKAEEPLRIVEGHCQDQDETVSQKCDVSQRKDSSSSCSSHSRSVSTPRSASTKNSPRQMTRTNSSDGSSASLPIGRSKSSSASSVTNQGVKIKATTPPSPGKLSGGSASSPSVNLRQGGSPDARGKPPVPKNDTTTAATSKCIVAAKYVNKDFRKSTLNMENGDPSRSKYARRKKCQRTVSVSSQDSETASEPIPQAALSGSSASLKSGRSRLRTTSGGAKTTIGGADSNGSVKWDESRCGSKSPCGRKKRPCGTFSSSNSSQSTSSSSEDDGERADRPGSRRRRKRVSESPTRETRGKISAGSSRTSVLASSADEISMTAEKPPRPLSSSRSKSDRSAKTTEEAKSFLMRALAPVTNFFKKSQDSSDTNKSGGWGDSNDENEISSKSGQPPSSSRSISQNLSKGPSFTNSERSDEIRGSRKRIQHQSSGEKPWWLDPNSDNIPEGIERASPWNDDVSQDTTISTILPDDGKYKLKVWRQESGERGWWLDDVSTEEPKKSSSSASPLLRRRSSRGSFRSADRRNRIRHQQSGERAWWMSDDPENIPEGIEVIPVASPDSRNIDKSDGFADNESLRSTKPLKKIRHIESGERAWWMDSSSNVPDGVVKIPAETSNSTSDSSESYEKIDIGVNPEPETTKRSLSRFPIEFPPPPPEEPLGDRASPEGVENPPDPPDNYEGRGSPYDNVQPTPRKLSPRKRPSTLPLFIGEHTDIDDVIGNTAALYRSPVLSRVRKQERVEEDFSEDSSECEKIDATQVIIHDSTPKTPVIQRRNRDTEKIQPNGYIPFVHIFLQHNTHSCR